MRLVNGWRSIRQLAMPLACDRQAGSVAVADQPPSYGRTPSLPFEPPRQEGSSSPAAQARLVPLGREIRDGEALACGSCRDEEERRR